MVELVAFRASAYRTPVRVRAHGAIGGRFHDPFSPPTQYFCLHPLGPWAEQLRRRGIDDPDDARELRLPVWAVRLRLPEPPLQVDFDTAAQGALPVPIEPAAIVDDDHGECRRLARALRERPGGPRVLRVPSAALPGTDNLVVLERRRMVEFARSPLRPTQVPAAVAADDATALPTLLALVRHAGQPHAAYEAWRRGRPYELPQVETAALG